VVADLFYGREKFGKTVRALAIGEEPLRERLRNAYAAHAHFAVGAHGSGGPAMSTDLQDRVLALDRVLTRCPAIADEGVLTATISSMSDDEIRGAIYEVLSIADDIERESAIVTYRP
jgi:hypothetical protein